MSKKESGIVLVLAIFILLVITILGVVFTTMMATEITVSERESQSVKALYLADIGIQYARYSAGTIGKEGFTLPEGIRDGDTYSAEVGPSCYFEIVFKNPYADDASNSNSVWVSSWGRVIDSVRGYTVERQLGVLLGSTSGD